MILGLQIIALIFILIMFYFSYLHYRRGEINGLEILSLLIIWVGAAVIVFFPTLFSAFSRTIAISRAFDLAVLGGFIFVIPMIYIAYVRTKRIEKKIEDFIRSQAIKDLQGDKKKK